MWFVCDNSKPLGVGFHIYKVSPGGFSSPHEHTGQEQFLLIEDAIKDIEDIQEELKESRHNATNISRLQKDVERLLNDLEKIKDKVRNNGNHN